MNFLGFILFENSLKNNTRNTITELQNALVDVYMITGDNIYTSINVGYKSRILEEDDNVWICEYEKERLNWVYQSSENRIQRKEEDSQHSIISSKAITRLIQNQHKIEDILHQCEQNKSLKIVLQGKAFEKIASIFKKQPAILEKILRYTRIFARSTSEQKKLIIDILKERNLHSQSYVGFVGDGSNDTMALKAANIGLSLGNDESSISAGFYTKRLDISSIVDILVEGKVCLGNGFQNFKYYLANMMFSSFIQTIITLQQWDFTTFDYVSFLIFSFPVAFFMSIAPRNPKLSFINQPPTLLNFHTIFQLLTLIFSHLLCFLTACWVMINSEYYKVYS